MTALSLSGLPLAAGGALAAGVGRTARWALVRFARAPLTYSAVIAMSALSLGAAGNALYFQTAKHPAPLFGPIAESGSTPAEIEVVIPAKRTLQRKAAPLIDARPTGSLPAGEPTSPIGNTEVFEVQRRLQAMKLFDGTVDGYYGPKTAAAIRAFEARHGMKPQGALSREVIDAILGASIITPEPTRTELRAPEPLPQALALPAELPAAGDRTPAKEPSVVANATAEPRVLRRDLPDSPAEALDIVADVASETFDSIVTAVGVTGPNSYVAPIAPKATARDPLLEIAAGAAEDEPAQAMSPSDPLLVAKVQRGLASLGFLAGAIDGVAGEGTAKAIRNFEVYHNYQVTGRVSPELVDLLAEAGASI